MGGNRSCIYAHYNSYTPTPGIGGRVLNSSV